LHPAVLKESYKHEEDAWRTHPREGAGSPPWMALIQKRELIHYVIDRVIPRFPPSRHVLEIGAGACWASSLIKFYQPSSVVYASDVSPSAITKGQALAGLLGVNIDYFCVADGESLPFEDRFFDVVFGCSVLHHYADLKKGLTEIYRVLNTGGLYIGIGESSRSKAFRWGWTAPENLRTRSVGVQEWTYSLAEWKRAFAMVGFGAVEVQLERDWRYVGVGGITSWLPLYHRFVASLPEQLAKFLPISISIRATKQA